MEIAATSFHHRTKNEYIYIYILVANKSIMYPIAIFGHLHKRTWAKIEWVSLQSFGLFLYGRTCSWGMVRFATISHLNTTFSALADWLSCPSCVYTIQYNWASYIYINSIHWFRIILYRRICNAFDFLPDSFAFAWVFFHIKFMFVLIFFIDYMHLIHLNSIPLLHKCLPSSLFINGFFQPIWKREAVYFAFVSVCLFLFDQNCFCFVVLINSLVLFMCACVFFAFSSLSLFPLLLNQANFLF